MSRIFAAQNSLSQRFLIAPSAFVFLLSTGLLGFVLLQTAWVSDDAMIMFRSVENYWAGIGLSFNPHERVQTYTHPLWMMLHLAGRPFFPELYDLTLFLSLICILLLISLPLFGTGAGLLSAAGFIILLCSSKGATDYATSGLENPLSYLLISAAALIAARGELSERERLLLYLFASLSVLNRHDLALIAAPVVAVDLIQSRFGKGSLRALLFAATPFLLWHLFSVFYYGFPFPNTAYAKLHSPFERALLLEQGLRYLSNSFRLDSPTLVVTALGTISAAVFGNGRLRALAAGVWLYLLYTVWIGGDFMSGRFLSVPFVVSAFLLTLTCRPPGAFFVLAAAVLALSSVHSRAPIYAHSYKCKKSNFDHGISDERCYYFKYTGLAQNGAERYKQHPWYKDGLHFRTEDERVAVRGPIGFFGLALGPEKILHDWYSLSSPFLARSKPNEQEFRPGHVERQITEQFVKSESLGRNLFQSKRRRRLYARLKSITAAPLFSEKRLKTLLRFHLSPLLSKRKGKGASANK